MQYVGGKTRVAKHVVQAILADTGIRETWVEPFVGGGNVMEHAAPHFKSSFGYDLHPDLILMWQHVSSGGSLPEHITEDMYKQHRHADPSWLRGFIGFGASFGGKWFGGWGAQKVDKKHPTGHVMHGSFKAVLRQASVFRCHGVRFECADYTTLQPGPDSVVYCDPPYIGTTGYTTGTFDHENFYRVLQRWSFNCPVYVSEYRVPSGIRHEVVWQRERRTSLKRDDNAEIRTEKLFRVLPAW